MTEERQDRLIRRCALLLFGAILFAWLLFSPEGVSRAFAFLHRVLAPFLNGVFLALILSIPKNYFEEIFRKRSKNHDPHSGLALGLAALCIVLIVAAVLGLVVPELIKTGVMLTENTQRYEEELRRLLHLLQQRFPGLSLDSLQTELFQRLEALGGSDDGALISSVMDMLANSVTGVVNFFLGVGFSFLLLQQNRDRTLLRRGVQVLIGEERTDRIWHFASIFVDSFQKFVSSKCLTSLILGVMCTVVALIFQIPNAVQAGVCVAVFNLIPIVGIFIGLAFSLLLIVFTAPVKALIFAVVSLVFWQICESFINPAVIGKRVGISAFWLFVAMIGGGAAFGILGMLFAVPLVNTIYSFLAEKVRAKEAEGL